MSQTSDNPIARAQAIASTFDISTFSLDMREEIRIRIRKSYDKEQISHYARDLCRGGLWHVDGPPRVIWLRSVQSRMTTRSILTTLCNKTTSVYCYNKLHPQDPQEDDYFDGSGILASCFFDEWFLYHKGKPDIEFSQFFANIIPISSKGPKSITEIIKAHISTCNDALSCLRAIQDRAQIQAPKQIYDNSTFQKNCERYRLNPLYYAIFIVIDTSCPPPFEPGRKLDLNKHSKTQNVLLIRTGYESNLSAPIDFKELREQCLPLCRPDMDISTDSVVRIPLATAVKFISNLEHREYTAFPELRVGTGPGKPSYRSAKWAEEEMNWTWEEASKKHNTLTPAVPISLMEATEAVVNGTPYREELFYSPYSPRFRGARFVDSQ